MPTTQVIILLKISLIRTQILKVILIQVINMKILQHKNLATQLKKTEEGNKNGIKHNWPKGTCVVNGDSMVAGIDECKMSSKHLIKVIPRCDML